MIKSISNIKQLDATTEQEMFRYGVPKGKQCYITEFRAQANGDNAPLVKIYIDNTEYQNFPCTEENVPLSVPQILPEGTQVKVTITPITEDLIMVSVTMVYNEYDN
jgi:hypothetical protein